MGSRLAGRLLTGPAAFLLAGLADFVAYWITVGRRAARKRVARPAAAPRRQH
jgi:hypothetical protein